MTAGASPSRIERLAGGAIGQRRESGEVIEKGYRYVLASPAEVGVHGEGRAGADLPAAAAKGVGVGVLAVGVPADRAPIHRRLGPHQIQELLRRR
jgi:hypothetical protein